MGSIECVDGCGLVDPVSLTLGAIAAGVVAKLSEKAADRAADGVVDAGATAGGKLIAWLRSRLSITKALDLAEAAPDSASAVARLGEVIDAEIVDDAARAELTELVDGVRVEVPSVYQNAIGHHIVQASNSTVQVNWPDNQAPQ
ncbi:MAG: hypothetical protein ACRCYU_03610 [Nocardioides sp.]